MDIVGIGSEITECLRIARLIERHGEQFLRRAFTLAEIHWCQKQDNWIQQYAALWAAKQAVLKALGLASLRGVHWPEIEICSEGSGKFRATLSGSLRSLASERNVSEVLVTLSHCRTHATAFAIALSPNS
jgi:holo-[acyl-carrier protein] synthase